MLLTISTTSAAPEERPATDLGFVLHKHPDRVRSVDSGVGRVHVFWPEAGAERATVAMLVDIDPVELVRRSRGRSVDASLEQYVNDRPYAASSFTSVALGRVFRTALAGTCTERPELVDQPFALEVHLPVLPCRGGVALLTRLFEPLGYAVVAEPRPLDTRFPSWGDSRYLDARLTGTLRVADALAHLYVLLPVLDDEKHYWVADDEIDKLLRRGGDWLRAHPDRELIVRRYLRRRGRLMSEALARLVDEDQGDPDQQTVTADREEEAAEDTLSLNEQRLQAVVAAVVASGARTVVDVGCGEGRLVQALLRESSLTKVAGMDVSPGALQRAARRLKLDELPERRRARVDLFQGSLTYRDARLEGFDVATCIEVVEHLDPPRLDAFERVLFGAARPRTVVLTTPNVEYNVRWPTLPAGSLRHRDHRFEWTRAELRAWADAVAERRGYTVTYAPIGPDDPEVGPPTQLAVFTR